MPEHVSASSLHSNSITAAALRRALVAASHRVMQARETLNRINVFPVPDGDTGSNLAATLGSVLYGALSRRHRHAGALLEHVSHDAIDGARGNSGAIMAQFLVGLAEAARNAPTLDLAMLVMAVRGGAKSARAALAQPVEGTIVSVMTAFSQAFETAAGEPAATPNTAFVAALQRARVALAETPRQMLLLQKAGVVDAGAQGFVEWLQGMADVAEAGPRDRRLGAATVMADTAAVVHQHQAVDPRRRYCIECLLLGADIDRARLRAALLACDIDSVVVAGSSSRVRVHGHAGIPQVLFDVCAEYGQLASMKADDMQMQQRSIESPNAVAVVTDSAADLPLALAERFGIHVVPVRVSLDGRDYLDRLGLTAAEFYRRMAACERLPQTSQPPAGDFRRIFEQVLGAQPAGVYVGVSRPLSGTLQSAESAARMQTKPLHCFDSGHVSVGQGLLAWRAGELAAAGASAEAILAELQRLQTQTRTFAIARDVAHAVRGGRIPRWAASVVRFSRLTPVAAINAQGLLKVAGGLWAWQRVPEAFARYVAQRLPQAAAWRVIVGHADAKADAEHLLAALQQRVAISESQMVDVGPAVGAHAGPGALLVGLQPAPCV